MKQNSNKKLGKIWYREIWRPNGLTLMMPEPYIGYTHLRKNLVAFYENGHSSTKYVECLQKLN